AVHVRVHGHVSSDLRGLGSASDMHLRRAHGRSGVNRIGIVRPLAVAALFAAPIFMDRYTAHVAVLALIFAIVAVGLSLVMGFAGQVNLAQAAFFGAAAYSASILTTQEHWSPWAAAPVAIAVAMAVAVVCGLPALRVQSH